VRASCSAAGIQSLGDKAKTGSPEHEPSSSISEWKNGRRPVDHRIHHDAHDLEVTKIQETKGGLEILIQIHKVKQLVEIHKVNSWSNSHDMQRREDPPRDILQTRDAQASQQGDNRKKIENNLYPILR